MDENDSLDFINHTQTPLREVDPIEQNRNEMIKNRAEIKSYVESPLVDACEDLWDKNVRTLSSSANSKDIGYEAYVIKDYDSLSDENKDFAREEGEFIENYDGSPAVKIKIPVTEETTTEAIKDNFASVASKFKKQKAVWIPSYTLGEMRKVYGIDPEDEKYGVAAFTEGGNFYYDPQGKKFYLSEEHFHKAKEEVK